MKKVFFALSAFCLILSPYLGRANCTNPAFVTNYADCNVYDGDSDSEEYEIDPANGLTFYLIATIDGSGIAYSSISWQSSGPVNFYDYYPGATHSPYYYDAYAEPGTMALSVTSTGAGSHAYVTAAW